MFQDVGYTPQVLTIPSDIARKGLHLSDTRDIARRDRQWLLWVLKRTGLAATGLANKTGLSETTITRPVRDENWPNALSAKTIGKIVEQTGLPSPEAWAAGFAEADAEQYIADAADPVSRAVSAMIEGRNNVDAWTFRSRALELAGVLPGDTVLVNLARQPRPGDIVVAQVYGSVARDTETVFRIFEPPYLVAASADPTFRRPYLIDPERVSVMGTVEARIASTVSHET